MKQNKDWTDVMRNALRDAEVTPPADGWARLERELKAPAPRISVLRRYWPRIAAAAAAVLIFVGGGELLLHENRSLGDKGFVIASATDSGSSAADNQTQPAGGIEALEESLRAIVPPQEVVQTASLPGEKTRVRQTVRTAHPATVIAQNVAQAVVAADVTDSRPQTVPENNAAESPQSEEANTQKQRAADASGEQKRTAPKESAVSARTYPSTTSYYGDEIAFEQPKPRRQTSVSLFAAGSVTSAGSVSAGPGPGLMMSDSPVGGSEGTMAQLKYNYDDYSFEHHQPLSFGLSVRKEFAHGLSLESGVNYTLLWADVRMKSSRQDISQKLHFIGVPLRMNWQFLDTGRFSLYVGAGGMVEKCVSAKFGSRAMDEPRVQWSVLGAAGAQYDLGGLVGLYFEPEVSYYFTETDLRTSRTDSPLSLTLRLGVRLSF
ncbi:MAG: porin family protein [Alistipes sp.]|nr:porin family protein [Alistipes sp.]